MNTGFFNQRATKKEEHSEAIALDVGHLGDSGFRALAVALLDHIYLNPRAHGDALKKILDEEVQYFPDAKLPKGMLTAYEKVQVLVTQFKMAEFILMLAYTLRQMAVDTLLKHPMRYRGALNEPHHPMSPADMRDATIWLNEMSLAALSDALLLPIQIAQVKLGQELPLTHYYGESFFNALTNPHIVIHLTDMQFLPEVIHLEKFQTVKSHLHLFHMPVECERNDPSEKELMLLLKDEDEKRLKHYDLLITKLMTMVRAGELNKNDLLNLYLNNLDGQQKLREQVPILGLEYGNQVYFEHLLKNYRGAHIDRRMQSSETYLIHTLVQALARAVALGQINEASFEQTLDAEAPYTNAINNLAPSSKYRSQT